MLVIGLLQSFQLKTVKLDLCYFALILFFICLGYYKIVIVAKKKIKLNQLNLKKVFLILFYGITIRLLRILFN